MFQTLIRGLLPRRGYVARSPRWWAWFGLAGAALIAVNGCGAGAAGGGGGGGGVTGPIGPRHANVTADAGGASVSALLQSGKTALVQLDASGSASANGDIVSYEWREAGCVLAMGAVVEVELDVGDHVITLAVTDATGASDEDDIVVTVVDDRPAGFALATSVEGSGQTDPPAHTTTSYALNSTATVTATPDPGWQFVRWSGDSEAATAAISVVMDSAKTLTAVFQPIPAGSVPLFTLPWAAHETRKTGQANNGTYSHEGRYAWDFTVDIGTPVLAAGAGRVVRIIDDIPNNTDDGTEDPNAPANIIQIDHGDGLQSLYAHLDRYGVAVVPGQRVAAGQYLGRSGNTGYSTGPHLHYEILDAAGNSVSTGFVEVVGNDGIAQEGDLVTSQNVLSIASLDEYVESSLAVDAFAENNIELFEPTPPAFFYTTGATYTATGRVTDRATNVCVALVDLDTQETVFCEPHLVSLDDTFEIDFCFATELSGNYLLGIVSGIAGVSGVAPVTVFLSAAAQNTPPSVVVKQPQDNAIDFGGTGTLRGSGSDPDGDSLTYLWAQTSGPPATIADPASSETTFTLGVGRGITTVRFQLTAFDGTEVSRPAEVEFRMPDNFHVTDIGVSDRECADSESCAAVAASNISAGRDYVTTWAVLLNATVGDLTRFEIRNPSGDTVLVGRTCDPLEEDYEQVFLRFSWTGSSLPPESGQWHAVFVRNGVEEASTAFSLGP